MTFRRSDLTARYIVEPGQPTDYGGATVNIKLAPGYEIASGFVATGNRNKALLFCDIGPGLPKGRSSKASDWGYER